MQRAMEGEGKREARRLIGFEGSRQFAEGSPSEVAAAAAKMDAGRVLIFDADTSYLVDVEVEAAKERTPVARVRPKAGDISAGTSAGMSGDESTDQPRRGPGRPNLGVVGREVTLLPRHWEWLAGRPGGASVTLRRLVEAARRAEAAGDRRRALQESAYRFMTHLAGDEAGYEEALRALFAWDAAAFARHTERWPADVRAHARELAGKTFAAGAEVADAGEVAAESTGEHTGEVASTAD